MGKQHYDLCIVGGGINGAGIARDAAGRGLSVLLVEQNDLAGATSSASTKLIHGGLRYLEYYEFGLVRHALAEREILMNLAPHIIWPLEFILPHDQSLRPAAMIRAGLLLYDNLGGRKKLPASKGLNLRRHPAGTPLKDAYRKGFSYADCWVEDARLVILNAMDAAARGATILTRVTCTGLAAESGKWRITLKDSGSGRPHTVTAAMAVNAAGPWVRSLLDSANLSHEATPQIRLVRGSHIVVRRLFENPQAYILQQPDRRIVFAIPYEKNFTLIGTTETAFSGDPAQARISGEETAYLLAAANRSFGRQITAGDIVWTYSGVRPLLEDGADESRAVTRDYRLTLDHSFGPPLLSVFGGKITTYRLLAQEAMDNLTGTRNHWTHNAPLPGGNIAGGDFETFAAAQQKKYAAFAPALIHRLARAYGTKMDEIIGTAKKEKSLGAQLGGDLYEAEAEYLIRHEWAKTAEDILWRRSKLGLHLPAETVNNLNNLPALKGVR